MTVVRAPGPPKEACRITICTSAEVPFVKTLSEGSIIINHAVPQPEGGEEPERA
jgi:hypothetical protein